MRLLREAVGLIWIHRQIFVTRVVLLYLVGAVLLELSFEHLHGAAFERLLSGEGSFLHWFVAGFGGTLLLWAVAGLGMLALAIMWHRSVLAPERIAPSVSTLGQYFIAFLTLATMLAFLIYLPTLFVMSFLLPSVSHLPGAYAAIVVVGGLSTLAASWLWLRGGLILPDAALGESDLGIGRSFILTHPRRGEIFLVAVVQAVLVQACLFVSDLLAEAPFPVESVILIVLWPLAPMLGLATLTALYAAARTEGEAPG